MWADRIRDDVSSDGSRGGGWSHAVAVNDGSREFEAVNEKLKRDGGDATFFSSIGKDTVVKLGAEIGECMVAAMPAITLMKVDSESDMLALWLEPKFRAGLRAMVNISKHIVDVHVALKIPLFGDSFSSEYRRLIPGKAMQQMFGYMANVSESTGEANVYVDMAVIGLINGGSQEEGAEPSMVFGELFPEAGITRSEVMAEWPCFEELEGNAMGGMLLAVYLACLDVEKTDGGVTMELGPFLSSIGEGGELTGNLFFLVNMLMCNSADVASLLLINRLRLALGYRDFFGAHVLTGGGGNEVLGKSVFRALQYVCIVFVYEMCVLGLANTFNVMKRGAQRIGNPHLKKGLKRLIRMHAQRFEQKLTYEQTGKRKLAMVANLLVQDDKNPRSTAETAGGREPAGLQESTGMRDRYLKAVDSMESGIIGMRTQMSSMVALIGKCRSERRQQRAVANACIGQAQLVIAAASAGMDRSPEENAPAGMDGRKLAPQIMRSPIRQQGTGLRSGKSNSNGGTRTAEGHSQGSHPVWFVASSGSSDGDEE